MWESINMAFAKPKQAYISLPSRAQEGHRKSKLQLSGRNSTLLTELSYLIPPSTLYTAYS